MLLVGDLIYDDELDLNCRYAVYDCRYSDSWQKVKYYTIAKRINLSR